MDPRIGRRGKKTLDPLHSMLYFAPELDSVLTGLGLQAGRMCYFAGRAAPMGAVGPGLVTATFYNFNPEMVARHIPLAWSIAAPDQVVAARSEAAEAALRRLLGDDVAAGPEVGEVARLAREACEACEREGRPLFAGHADLEWPAEAGQAHLVLWHAVSQLREYRGDAHVAALQSAGLSGLEALVLDTLSGQGMAKGFVMDSRGWSEQQWSACVDALRERELLDESGALTQQGNDLREQVEEATDELDRAPWERLGPERCERLLDLGKSLTRTVVKAGAFPAKLFA